MKILDRYVLSTFLKNYLISLAVLIGMYVIMDMVFNFDEVVSVQKQSGGGLANLLGVIRGVGSYYFYQAFLIFVHLSGMIPVLAAAFTLMRFSRFGELTAFLAAGMPLLRVTVPIILASVLLNMLLVVDQEVILPNMIGKLGRKHEEMFSASVAYYRINTMQLDAHTLLMAARYHPAAADVPPYLEEMDVLERNDDLQPSTHLIADSATWDAAQQMWILKNGRRSEGLAPGDFRSAEQPVAVFKGKVTPEELALYHSSGFVELLPTRRINELIAARSYGTSHLNRIKNLRVTQPVMNVILLLLAIPTVLTHDPKALKRAATKCLTLTGVAMGSVFLCQQIAGNPPAGHAWLSLWPALLAWVPIFIFGPLSVWLMDRVKS